MENKMETTVISRRYVCISVEIHFFFQVIMCRIDFPLRSQVPGKRIARSSGISYGIGIRIRIPRRRTCPIFFPYFRWHSYHLCISGHGHSSVPVPPEGEELAQSQMRRFGLENTSDEH